MARVFGEATRFLGPNGDRSPNRTALPPLPRQRRRRMLVLGVLVVVVGALAAGYLFAGMSDRTAVVMMVRNVPVGTQIGSADVATTRVAVDAPVGVIPGSEIGQVVGHYAAVDLRK